MKISRTKFIMLFVVLAFAFQFISNSFLGSEVRLFPVNGEWFPGTGVVSAIIYPVKVVLVGPLSPVFTEPDPPPPILVIAFALYWSVIALLVHFLLTKIIPRKKHE